MYKSRVEGKGQESIQSSTIADPEFDMGKWQKLRKHNTQAREPRGQPFPSGGFRGGCFGCFSTPSWDHGKNILTYLFSSQCTVGTFQARRKQLQIGGGANINFLGGTHKFFLIFFFFFFFFWGGGHICANYWGGAPPPPVPPQFIRPCLLACSVRPVLKSAP